MVCGFLGDFGVDFGKKAREGYRGDYRKEPISSPPTKNCHDTRSLCEIAVIECILAELGSQDRDAWFLRSFYIKLSLHS